MTDLETKIVRVLNEMKIGGYKPIESIGKNIDGTHYEIKILLEKPNYD